jgi:hypothetical protein
VYLELEELKVNLRTILNLFVFSSYFLATQSVSIVFTLNGKRGVGLGVVPYINLSIMSKRLLLIPESENFVMQIIDAHTCTWALSLEKNSNLPFL